MLSERKYWYVLFTRTGAEEQLVKSLKDKLGKNYIPFIPQKTCIYRRHGKKLRFTKICFPGYVFIESYNPAEEFIKKAYPTVYKLKGAYRFLCYGDRSDIAMQEEERIALSRILDNNHHIDISIGFKEGDTVKVISGALAGNESEILRINKKRHEAILGISMFGTVVPIAVGLEVIEK